MVIADRLPGDDAPVSSTTLDEDEIGLGRPTLELGEALSQVPGVFVSNRSNFAQDTRLSIRGFGSRAAFGIRGVRVLLDGIPLTLPDGQSQVDSLDLQNVGRIEVLRGPAGSLYGNAAGGVLALESRRAPATPEVELTNTVGAFGLWKVSAAVRARVGESEVSAFASRTAMEGWRRQSAVEQVVAQSSIHSRLGSKVRLSTHVHYVNAPVADDPGGLTPEDFERAPRSAAETNRDFATGEDLSQLQVGQRLRAELHPEHAVEVVGYAGMRGFEGRIPFRIVAFDRDFFGGLGMYRWSTERGPALSRLTAGVEVQGQQDDRRNEGSDGGLPDGTVELSQQERATSLGVFAQERLDLARLGLLGSVRYDRVAFSLTDRLLGDGDLSGSRTFDRVTGQGGAQLHLAEPVAVFANLSQSFETPTLSELVNSSGDGGLDADLRAQEALSAEGGVRLRGQGASVDVTAFWIGLRNELIRQEDDKGRAFFTNAGRSRRLGAEALARVAPVDWLELLGSYAWLRATFREPDRLGVLVPGLPEHRGFARVRVIRDGLHAAAEVEATGAQWADDANTVRADAWALLGLRAGYTLRWRRLEADLTIGVRNLLDARYVDNIRVNAFGDRYFEAGSPRHLYGQLVIARR